MNGIAQASEAADCPTTGSVTVGSLTQCTQAASLHVVLGSVGLFTAVQLGQHSPSSPNAANDSRATPTEPNSVGARLPWRLQPGKKAESASAKQTIAITL